MSETGVEQSVQHGMDSQIVISNNTFNVMRKVAPTLPNLGLEFAVLATEGQMYTSPQGDSKTVLPNQSCIRMTTGEGVKSLEDFWNAVQIKEKKPVPETPKP